MSLIDDIKLKYYTATIVEKLIAINVIAFVLFHLFTTSAFLFKLPEDFLGDWLLFPKELGEYMYKPWTIITYAFMHGGLWHLLFNMILLYFSGHFFMTYFSGKRVLTVYLLGAISGALVYMLSYNLFPAFDGIGNSVLIGASASVMAVLIAVTTYSPNMIVRLFILGNIKLWWIAAFFLMKDIIQIPIGNAGGHLAHLGGAFFGYLYASQLKKGSDIGAGFEKLVEGIGNWFSGSKKAPLKTVHKSKRSTISTKTARNNSKTVNSDLRNSKRSHQQQIDSILDKISKSGYDSLTKEEKDFLFKVGKE